MRSFRSKLSAQPQMGLCITYPAPGIAERIVPEWDWVWVDGQHGELSYTDVLGIVRACDLVDRPAFVRVPGHEYGAIGKALDTGAGGLIVPCVDTVEQAQQIVDAAKFPPLGKRSYGGRRVIDRYGAQYFATANEDVMLVLQIESVEAAGNVDAIAALPGVDGLFLGPDDMMLRRGHPMDGPRSGETLGSDMKRVAEACRRHGKIGVMVGINEEIRELCLELGFQMIVGGSDVGFLVEGSRKAADVLRSSIQGNGNSMGGKAIPKDAPSSIY